eukprot:645770-Pyramimonas_sp.AAC.1
MGARPLRLQEKARLRELQRRRRRLHIFWQVAGRKNSVPWRAGAQPAVAHGAGVSGTNDVALVVARP